VEIQRIKISSRVLNHHGDPEKDVDGQTGRGKQGHPRTKRKLLFTMLQILACGTPLEKKTLKKVFMRLLSGSKNQRENGDRRQADIQGVNIRLYAYIHKKHEKRKQILAGGCRLNRQRKKEKKKKKKKKKEKKKKKKKKKNIESRRKEGASKREKTTDIKL